MSYETNRLIMSIAASMTVMGWLIVPASSAECTNKTPVDCYTDGIKQVESVLGKLKELEAKIADDRLEIDKLRQIAAPHEAVVAFVLEKCPEGWSRYEPVIGRFIRGIDPNGSRRIGSPQDDAFQGHTFGDGGDRIFRFSTANMNSMAGDGPGFGSRPSSGIFGQLNTNPHFGAMADAMIVSDGSHGGPRVAEETRPANIGLLYCKRD